MFTLTKNLEKIFMQIRNSNINYKLFYFQILQVLYFYAYIFKIKYSFKNLKFTFPNKNMENKKKLAFTFFFQILNKSF